MNFFRNIKQALALDQDFTTFSPSFQPKVVSKLGYSQTCFAFDPVQGYFAIGQQNGNVVLLNVLEHELANPENQIPGSAIVSLLFHNDQLIGTNATGQLIVWNLSSKTSFCQSFTDPILKVDSNPESTWLVISFKSGLTKLMDSLSGRFSEYYIATSVSSSTLKDMALNPNDLNQILLGFDSECIVWDFAQKRPVERYVVQNLTSCTWKPEGSSLVTGCKDGTVSIWTTKKGFFGKAIVKPLLTKTYENPVSTLQWVQFDGDSSFLYIGFANTSSMVCLEIHGEKYEKSVETVIPVEFVYTSILVLLSNTTRMVIAYNYELTDLFISIPQTKYPVELPSSLKNATFGPHSTSCISDDGFLLSSAIKNNKAKSVPFAFGGTVLAKSSVRNYHVQAILRKGYVEFWLMSIPFPAYLSRVKLLPSTPDIIEMFLDLKQNRFIMMSEKSVIICELIKQSLVEDVDEMMDKLDDTIAALDEDRKEIQKMHDSKPKTLEPKPDESASRISKSKSMESVKSIPQPGINAIPKSMSKDSLPSDKPVKESTFKTKAGNPVLLMVKAFRKKAKQPTNESTKDEHLEKLCDAPKDLHSENIDNTSSSEAIVDGSSTESLEANTKAKAAEKDPEGLGDRKNEEQEIIVSQIPDDAILDSKTNSEEAEKPGEASREIEPTPTPALLAHPRSSSLQATKIIDSPPLYIADANWTVLFQIDLPSPIVSYFCCNSQRMYAVCTSDLLTVVHQDHSILFEANLLGNSYFKGYEQLAATAAITKCGIYRVSDRWCILVATTQSIFLFDINKRKISPYAVFHCNTDFGLVLELVNLGHEFSQNPVEDEKYLLLCSTSSVIIFDIDQGEISQLARRDFGFLVNKAAVSRIEEKTVLIVVSADAIVVLAVPQLNVIFKYSLSKLPVAKAHISEAYISTQDGLVGLWLDQNRWILISLSNTTRLPQYDLKVFDTHKLKKYGDQLGKRSGKRSEVADSLFAPKPAPTNDVGADSLASDFAKIGNALNERGEKLNELQEKTGQVADASRTFAERARELARLEKEKKWYQL